MIEINLSTTKKALDVTNIGGMDLSQVKVKFVLIAILILYIPDFTLIPSWEEERTTTQATVDELQSKSRMLKKKVDELKEFDLQVKKLRDQEDKLKKRLEVVKQIISTKKNPWNIFVYIAKNIPPEVWLVKMSYKEDRIIMKGLAQDYKLQGIFQENLKKSVFLDKNIGYTKVNDIPMAPEEKGFAPFEITAKIIRYE